MPDRDEVLRAARLPFVELLASLDSDGWATPSLCDGWTVQEVAAHVAETSPERAREIGDAALARVLSEHTYAHRAVQLDALLGEKAARA